MLLATMWTVLHHYGADHLELYSSRSQRASDSGQLERQQSLTGAVEREQVSRGLQLQFLWRIPTAAVG